MSTPVLSARLHGAQVPALLWELAGGGENGTTCVLRVSSRAEGCDLVWVWRSGGANFDCREGWAWGDVQAWSLKAEPRGCSGGFISSVGEVRQVSHLSQSHVDLLERLNLLLLWRSRPGSRDRNVVKTTYWWLFLAAM